MVCHSLTEQHREIPATNCLGRVAVKTRPAAYNAALQTEYREYARAGISSCRSIRPLLDVIPAAGDGAAAVRDGNRGIPQGLVFQWMERNLGDFAARECRQDYALLKAVATGVLQALVPFEHNGRIHSGSVRSIFTFVSRLTDSDIKPDNILIDCPGPCAYEAKLSDLGECRCPQPAVPFHQGIALTAAQRTAMAMPSNLSDHC